MRVIGAGLGRTGTNSLKIALEMLLDGPCYHMFELFQRPQDVTTWQAAVRDEPVDWTDFMQSWSACVDWPAAPFFDQLAHAFPDALVLLSVRDPAEWFQSASQTIFGLMRKVPREDQNPIQELVESQLERWMTSDIENEAEMIAAFERHSARVRSLVPKNRLIEWSPGDGWEPLCSALKMPIPSQPFPHANAGGDFRATVAKARAGHVERGFSRANASSSDSKQ
ncbi:MAG: hypothetical protein CBC48_17280 [bacterium TMED88]|nr:sulfotransferase family protein [Deltaproteobacteria bacterium]OUV24706.1 MAG: hypothetical protein CBC48_17280 [bacterium TMED88]